MKVTDQQIIEACQEHSTMRKAAMSLDISLTTLKGRAVQLGVYQPNQGRRNEARPEQNKERLIPLDEIIRGEHPTYQTHKLRLRLFKAGLKEQKCEICSTSHWNGQQLSLILDHVNGINDDHRLENLRIVCPNCDSLLPTFCGRNKKKKMVPGTGLKPV